MKNDILLVECTGPMKRYCAGECASEGRACVVGDVEVDKVEESILLQAVPPSPACDWDSNELDACIEYQRRICTLREYHRAF